MFIGTYEIEKEKYIYHYTTMEKAIKYIIPEKRLRLSPIKNMNDPEERFYRVYGMEGIIDPENLLTSRELSERCGEILTKIVKCVSFSVDDTVFDEMDTTQGYGFCKPRMWAQYATNHQGICLAFDKEIITKVAFENFSNRALIGNVFYCNYPTSLATPIDLKIMEEMGHTQYLKKFALESGKILYFVKNKDWTNESEFRIICVDTEKEYLYINIEKSLKHIIFGIDSDEKELKTVQSLIREYKNKPLVWKLIYCGLGYGISERN